jgi:hypothetical protein
MCERGKSHGKTGNQWAGRGQSCFFIIIFSQELTRVPREYKLKPSQGQSPQWPNQLPTRPHFFNGSTTSQHYHTGDQAPNTWTLGKEIASEQQQPHSLSLMLAWSIITKALTRCQHMLLDFPASRTVNQLNFYSLQVFQSQAFSYNGRKQTKTTTIQCNTTSTQTHN